MLLYVKEDKNLNLKLLVTGFIDLMGVTCKIGVGMKKTERIYLFFFLKEWKSGVSGSESTRTGTVTGG